MQTILGTYHKHAYEQIRDKKRPYDVVLLT